MAAAAASATLTFPSFGIQHIRRALHTDVAVADPQALALTARRRAAPQPQPPETGPEMNVIYYDPRGITKRRQRGTVAHRFLSVDNLRRQPFDLLISEQFAGELQFGGAYRVHVDYGEQDSVPLVVHKPDYISRERTVVPTEVRFNTNTLALEMKLQGSGRKVNFARGAEAAAMLTTLGFPQSEWTVADGADARQVRVLQGMPEVALHSVVTHQGGQWHVMGLPFMPGRSHRIAPVTGEQGPQIIN